MGKSSNLHKVAVFVAVTAALLVPSLAQAAASTAGEDGEILLRRDGSKAVPFDPVAAVTLRRDGSRAVPFDPDLGPQPASAESGFQWAEAALGAAVGAGIALMLVVAVPPLLRRPRDRRALA